MEPNTEDYLNRLEQEKEQLREEMHKSGKNETN